MEWTRSVRTGFNRSGLNEYKGLDMELFTITLIYASKYYVSHTIGIESH
jgi:hypothetical protein